MRIAYDYSGVPTIAGFSHSDAFIRGVMGPFGSGKSSGCVVEFPYRASNQQPGHDGVRRTRWAVIRNCFDDQTQILTEGMGWQFFRDLLPEDRVATLRNDSELVFERPSYYYAAHHRGPMIGVQSDSVDMLVTPDHRLYVSTYNWGKFSFQEASKVYATQVGFRVDDASTRARALHYPPVGCWQRVDYDGMVYCVEVSSHVVYVRRNGKAHWSSQTYGQLRDTTIPTFHRWLPPEYFGRWYSSDHRFVVKAFAGIEFEVLFRALDKPEHIRNLLSLDLTGGWINEAREVPWAIVEALQGRVGRYPPQDEGGATWSGIWMDTNPPDVDSRWYRFFEEKDWLKDFEEMKRAGGLPPGIVRPEQFAAIFHQPSGLSPDAENLAGLPGGPAYYQRMKIGKSTEWVKVYVEGKYGFVTDNKIVFPEFNDRIHIKEADPVPGRTIERQWDFGLCYSEDTEVLTEQGWKLFKDVDCAIDMIATRDPDTGAMEYARAAFKIAKPYKGEMLEWSSTELNICVTPEHRVPFTYRDSPGKVHWQSAEWLATHMTGHHYVDLLSKWSGERDRPVHWLQNGSGRGLENELAFAQFMGLWLAEGSVNGKTSVVVYQMKRRPEMEAILAATGLGWRWFDHGKTKGWRAHDASVALYLRQFGTQPYRFVPFCLKKMPPETIRAFIMAYTAGDGHIRTRPNGSVEHTLFTSSARMAGDMQDLAQKAGWNSAVAWQRPGRRQKPLPDGRIIKGCGGWRVTFKKVAARAELLKRNFRRVPYDGFVYCLNVPHHTLYVRRGGKPSWNGNTPACTFSQVLPNGQWLIFDELVATGMGADRFSDEVLEHCSRAFRGHADFDDLGDPSGDTRVQTDEATCFEILRSKGIQIRGGEQNLALRLESVRKPLRTLGDNGEPRLVIHPRCRNVRKAFLGAYYYRRLQMNAERFASEPEKNHPFSDLMDTIEYRAVEHFGGGLTGTAPQDNSPRPPRATAGKSRVTGY